MKDDAQTLNSFQESAEATAIYPKGRIDYLCLGLCGEAGEVAEIVKRTIRSERSLTHEENERIAFELGDCLWYVANLAREIGYPLSRIAEMNREKLSSRKTRGVIEGKGDFR